MRPSSPISLQTQTLHLPKTFQYLLAVLATSLLLTLTSCGTDAPPAIEERYADSLLDLADVQPSDSAATFLHAAYAKFPKAGPLAWYKKYDFLFDLRSNTTSARLIYTDSMLMALKGRETLAPYSGYYVLTLLKRAAALSDAGLRTESYRAYLQARRQARNSDSSTLSTDHYRQLGDFSGRFGRYDEALKYYSKLYVPYSDSLLQHDFEAFINRQSLLLVTGTVYEKWEKYTEAMVCFQKALGLSNRYTGPLPDGGNYLRTSKALILYSIARLEHRNGQLKEASDHLYASITLYAKHTKKDVPRRQAILLELGAIWAKQQRTAGLDSLLSVVRQLLNEEACEKNEFEWHLLNSTCRQQQGQFETALVEFQTYSRLKEEFEARQVREKDIDLNRELEAIENEMQLSVLREDKQTRETYLLLIGGLAITLTGTVALIFRNWRQTRKNLKTLTQLNNQINTQKNQLERAVRLHDISQAISKTAGWEYNRVSDTLTFSRQSNVLYDGDHNTFMHVDELKGLFNAQERQIMNRIGFYTLRRQSPLRFETEIHTALGTKKWVRIIAEPVFENGRATGSIGAIQDITFEKQAEERLRRLTRHLQALMTMMEDIVFEIDGNWVFQNVLVRDESMLFMPKDKFIGRSITSIFGPEAMIFIRPIEEVIANGGAVETEYPHIDPNTNKWYKAKTILVEKAEQPANTKIVVSVHDITLRKHQELALEEVRKKLEQSNNEKDRIMQVLVHDLRSPLSAIHAVSNLLLQKGAASGPEKEMLDVISDTSLLLFKMVSELVDISLTNEHASVNKENINLVQLIRQVVSAIQFKADEKSQKIFTEVEDPLLAHADPHKVQRVLTNLLTNAIKFSPTNATITVNAIRRPGAVRISVRDNGIGIPEELRHRVFDVFTAAKRYGTNNERSFGLGLSISKQIVEAHGGRIWFNENETGGTVFHTEFPEPANNSA